jgi:ferritin-like metal-binding protein YciE
VTGSGCGEVDDKVVLDVAIVAGAQAVEHYEICRYGTLIAWAEKLGHDKVVRFLTTNLNEEKAANTELNTIALRNVKVSNAATQSPPGLRGDGLGMRGTKPNIAG